ncbi:hypothetical protein D3C78_1201740 [compost metagenome]
MRLQLHPHRRQGTAADLHFAHALNLGQALGEDGGRQVVELALLQHIGGQRQHHDRRLGRVDLLVGGHAAHAAGQQVARGVDGRLHVAGGAVDVPVQVELHDDPRRALAGAAGHLVDPGNGAEGPFQWRGDAGGHDLRAGAGQAGLHGDHREVHLRQRRHRQQAEADAAQQEDRQAQQHGGDRAVDEGGGEVHSPSPSGRRWPEGSDEGWWALLDTERASITLTPTLSRKRERGLFVQTVTFTPAPPPRCGR